ncbi:MAG: ribosome biogenesis GTP-binding protein YihA/YsxC [Fibrobacteraceae bacterium]|nr:ribosome biogenesis GTP-binding protein YihA/YsxC [Fibrobacteraceae bacterium]
MKKSTGEAAFKVFEASFEKGVTALAAVPSDGLSQVAVLGRSNVGKSSLLSALLGKKNLVKISSKPGKTREINFFKVNGAFYLVDLPGVGFAGVNFDKVNEMENSIKEYIEGTPALKGLIYLIDSRLGPLPIDIKTVESVRASGCPVFLAISKCDKANQSELALTRSKTQKAFGISEQPLRLSTLKKIGLDKLWSEILSIIAEERK